MDPLDPIDFEHPDFGDQWDELPLWSAPFGLRLLECVPMRRGATILDAGAGTGFLSLELAQRCGPSATIIAVDPWAAAVRRLRSKLAYLRLQNVVVLEQDITTVDLADGSVDCIVSNLGVNNFADVEATLGTLHRLAKPGAELVLTTNLVGHMAEFYEILRATLVELGQHDRLQALDEHVRHRGTVTSITARLQGAGFEAVEQQTDTFTMRFLDGAALLRHHFIRLGFVPGWAQLVSPDALHETFATLERNLDAVAAAHGELSLTIPMACIRATKPTRA